MTASAAYRLSERLAGTPLWAFALVPVQVGGGGSNPADASDATADCLSLSSARYRAYIGT